MRRRDLLPTASTLIAPIGAHVWHVRQAREAGQIRRVRVKEGEPACADTVCRVCGDGVEHVVA
jgi:hypothetical protein